MSLGQAEAPSAARQDDKPRDKIGIIAGGGTLPIAVARGAIEKGHEIFIVGLAGNADAAIREFPHAFVDVLQIGRAIRLLREQNCRSIVFIGSIRRPRLLKAKIDSGLLFNLPRILRILRGGDDSVLRAAGRFFEEKGFSLRAAHDFVPNLLAPEGRFSNATPNDEALEDIRLGLRVIKAMGAFDIGQSAVIARQYVLAIEAAEGTDAMLDRCKGLNNWGVSARQGVLVKMPKPGQDLRFDMPAIGPRTVELAAAAGLAGIAVAAGSVLLAEPEELVEKADKHGLFLHGVSSSQITRE